MLASNSEIHLPLPPRVLGLKACATTAWLIEWLSLTAFILLGVMFIYLTIWLWFSHEMSYLLKILIFDFPMCWSTLFKSESLSVSVFSMSAITSHLSFQVRLIYIFYLHSLVCNKIYWSCWFSHRTNSYFTHSLYGNLKFFISRISSVFVFFFKLMLFPFSGLKQFC